MPLERVNEAEGAETLQAEDAVTWDTYTCHLSRGAALLCPKVVNIGSDPVNRRLLAGQAHLRGPKYAVVLIRMDESIFLVQEEATGT